MIRYLFLHFLLFLPFLSFGEAPFEFSDSTKIMEVNKSVMIVEDKKNQWSIEDIVKSDDFKKANQVVPNLGVTSSSWWVKISIKNNTNYIKLLLKIDFPIIDEIDFYSFDGKAYNVIKLGEFQNFSNRKYKDPNYIFDLTIPKNETKTYYLRIKSGEQIMLPITIGVPQEIFEQAASKDTIFGIYFGIIIVMFLYNLFLYFTIKDKSYLFYVFYILCVGLTQTFLHGYTFKYLWPNSPWLAIHSMYFLPSLVGIAIAEFAKVFLQVKEYSKQLNNGLNFIISIYLVCILLAIAGLHNLSQQVIHINAMLVSLFTLYIGIKISLAGNRPAKFFVIAWFFFLIGVCLFILKDLVILPYNNLTIYAMPAGSALEVILLSFALADRINILKKEKEESQVEALKVSKENEDIIKRQNIILDIKVTERTEELEKSNEELNLTLHNLKETQSKLVDAEKMASLGQLTAGIAHEINNPINFVSSSINPLKRDIADILTILDKYDELSNDGNIDQKLNEVKILKKDLDLDYLKKEIITLLTGIDEGANRTAEIVKGLRNFSRMDEDDLKLANIHEGIDSSLVLLNSTLGGRIDISKSYGNIPSIECYAGKLNQVFMNILTNATQAISANKDTNGKGIITIKTFEKDTNIIVSLKDSGPGMTEEVKNKVFEPFFTTKEVGEGTGLGLSIVFSIIEAHKGLIEVVSEIGKGTEFIITLPKIQKS
jgi:signal transduction histidine kinase